MDRSRSGPDACSFAKRSSTVKLSENETVSETFATIPSENGTQLMGVLCESEDLRADMRTAVILPNSGSVHHVGPNRLHVELARELARSGIASFRFDLRNLGDSRIGQSRDENQPYPATATADVRFVLEWLCKERGFESCIVTGLCSGAHTAYHAGFEIEDSRISAIVSINPLTFRRTWHVLDTPAVMHAASYLWASG